MSLETTTTPEGLRIYVDTIPSAETTKINAFVGVGSVHESDKLAGISHALEHCVHISTKLFPNEQALDEFTGINSLMANADTYYNRTCYYATGPYVEPNMKRLGQILFQPTFDPTYIDNEMLTVAREGQEFRDNIDSLHGVASDLTLFGKPYGRNVGGYADNIDYTSEQLKKFYKHHYTASNMAIVAVGNVSMDEILKYSKKYFEFTHNEKPSVTLPIPKRADTLTTGLLSGASSAVVRIASPMDSSFVERYMDNKTAYIAGAVAINALCYQHFRTDTGISYDSGFFISDYNSPNAWSLICDATVDPQKINEAKSLINDIFSRTNDNYSDTAIASAIGSTRSDILCKMDSIEDRTELYIQNLEQQIEPIDPRLVADSAYHVQHDSVRLAIDDIVEHIATHPPITHITGPKKAIKSVDKIIEVDEIA